MSRRWKGVIILSTPTYWTRIAIPPLLEVSTLTAHLNRSRKCLLDVEIIVYLGAAALRPSLGAAISSVHRWRSIRTYLGGTGEQLQVLFGHLDSLNSPSLCHVCIDAYETFIDFLDHKVHYPDFLFPQCSPALERLEIYTERLGILDDFPAYSTFTHLSVQYH